MNPIKLETIQSDSKSLHDSTERVSHELALPRLSQEIAAKEGAIKIFERFDKKDYSQVIAITLIFFSTGIALVASGIYIVVEKFKNPGCEFNYRFTPYMIFAFLLGIHFLRNKILISYERSNVYCTSLINSLRNDITSLESEIQKRRYLLKLS